MATIINNQASLTYNYGNLTGSATSNIASSVLQGTTSLEKYAIPERYTANDNVTYQIILTNNGNAPLNNVSITDNLGTYQVGNPSVDVTPLDYKDYASLRINGVDVTETLVVRIFEDRIVFSFPTLEPNAIAEILYSTTVNKNAPLDKGSTIINTVTATADNLTAISANSTISVEDYANVTIVKTMSPSVINNGDTLTYDFTIYNYGNLDATNVVFTDVFNPAPTDISVTLNGVAIPDTEYSYTNGTFILPSGETATTSITVPSATFVQDQLTGVITVNSGITKISIKGTVNAL